MGTEHQDIDDLVQDCINSIAKKTDVTAVLH